MDDNLSSLTSPPLGGGTRSLAARGGIAETSTNRTVRSRALRAGIAEMRVSEC
jgi:hypothetical protein